MTTSNLIYLPPADEGPPGVLTQFLPRLPHGAAARWLGEQLPEKGQWVIDPFGASPQLAIEAARAGYRVLVVTSNPITHFMLNLLADPPTGEAMQAALADLATAKRGDDRMEQHIRELYTTRCDNCGMTIDARAFLWSSDTLTPYARIYTCPHCQHSGEFPASDEDIEKASRFSQGGQHHARALQRVTASQDPNRFHAEEALDAHLPRAVYALITMINKLDGIDLEGEEGKLLRALLLAACDKGNNLWRIPSEYTRPKQLTTPPRFIEHNLWLALEEAVHIWASGEEAVPLTVWPKGPPETGGIVLYQGRIKQLAQKIDEIPVAAVISALPRPNQAFWTLSALWAGLLPQKTPFFGMVTENEAGFDASVLAAADAAGFVLGGVALRVREGQTQFVWHLAEDRPEPPERISKIARDAAREIILARGEPTPYLHLQAAVTHALSEVNGITPTLNEEEESTSLSPAGEGYNRIRQLLLETLTPTGSFLRYQGGKSSIEIGKWWPKNEGDPELPLADRVEMRIVNLLQVNQRVRLTEVNDILCAEFTGLQTPDIRLIRTILSSYAEREGDQHWRLRENDTAAHRREDVDEIYQLLGRTGERLGYSIVRDEGLIWSGALGGKDLHFTVIASAMLTRIMDAAAHPPAQGIIVLPGGRAELIMFKRERDPRLSYRLDGGWRFLKFRHVRRMAESKSVSVDNLASYLALDPITVDEAQMPLL